MESGANIGSGGYRHEVVSHDVDEFACSQPNWSLRYEQISTGRFLGKLQFLQFEGMRMVCESTTCATWQRGQLGAGNIGFAMPVALNGHGSFNGQPLTRDTVMIGRSETLDLCLACKACKSECPSNVDIAREFVNLIEAQRGFQANARVISATDSLLAELVNIIR